MHRMFVVAVSIACSMFVLADRPLLADGKQKPANDQSERVKWENRIVFFGDEATGEWSLRIHDSDVDAQRLFKLLELWTYNRESKHWERTGTEVLSSWMLPPGKKKQDPDAEPDPDATQILAELPIDKDQVGLFYAKWAVDDVHGATFCRIGTGLEKKSEYVHKPPPEGQIWVVLPIDLNHSIPAYIPIPEIACRSGTQ